MHLCRLPTRPEIQNVIIFHRRQRTVAQGAHMRPKTTVDPSSHPPFHEAPQAEPTFQAFHANSSHTSWGYLLTDLSSTDQLLGELHLTLFSHAPGYFYSEHTSFLPLATGQTKTSLSIFTMSSDQTPSSAGNDKTHRIRNKIHTGMSRVHLGKYVSCPDHFDNVLLTLTWCPGSYRYP